MSQIYVCAIDFRDTHVAAVEIAGTDAMFGNAIFAVAQYQGSAQNFLRW